jgi:hypothetical protein
MKARVCLPVVLAVAAAASAQGARVGSDDYDTRTFPDAECSYTLPARDWEWIDPRSFPYNRPTTMHPVALARNRNGHVLYLLIGHATERLDSRAYLDYEAGVMSFGQVKRLGSRHLDFKGVPSYQLDIESTGVRYAGSMRIMYANDKCYHLQVNNSSGDLLTPEECEQVFQGFSFIGSPRPMLSPHEPLRDNPGGSTNSRQWLSARTGGLVALVLASFLFFGACFVIWLRRSGLSRT